MRVNMGLKSVTCSFNCIQKNVKKTTTTSGYLPKRVETISVEALTSNILKILKFLMTKIDFERLELDHVKIARKEYQLTMFPQK